jgi:hypothetical protein
MSRRRKATTAAVLVISGGGIALGALILSGQGLDRASQWVIVVGFFVSTVLGAGGLALGWLSFRQASTSRETAQTGQIVRDSGSSGGVVQVSDVARNVRIRSVSSKSGRPLPTAPKRTPEPEGGEASQSVTGSDVGGSIEQVRRTGGDVDIER